MKYFKNVFLVSIIGLILAANFSCQVSSNSWERIYEYGSSANSVILTSDNGYVILGEIGFDALLMKTNSLGDTIWTKRFGEGPSFESHEVYPASDGGYLITGRSGNDDMYLIKIDEHGDTLWTNTLDGIQNAYSISFHQASDGGYIILGNATSLGKIDAKHTSPYLIKISQNGEKEWKKIYVQEKESDGNSVEQTADTGYIIAGSIGKWDSTGVLIIKTDKNGNTLWTKILSEKGKEEGRGIGYDIKETKDGNYVMVGSVNFDMYLVKLSKDGDILWTRTYGGQYRDCAHSIQQTKDGGFIIVGYTTTLGKRANCDVYLVRTDRNGNIQWERIKGGEEDDFGNFILQTSDGGFIVAGYTYSKIFGTEGIYLIKTDAMGNSPGIQYSQKESTNKYAAKHRVKFANLKEIDLYEVKFPENAKDTGIVIINKGAGEIVIKHSNGRIERFSDIHTQGIDEVGTVDLSHNGNEHIFFATRWSGCGRGHGIGYGLYLLDVQKDEIFYLELSYHTASPVTTVIPDISTSKNLFRKERNKEKDFLETIKYDYGYIAEDEINKQLDNPNLAFYFWVKENGNIKDGIMTIRRYKGEYMYYGGEKGKIVDGNIVYSTNDFCAVVAYDKAADEHYVLYHTNDVYKEAYIVEKVGSLLIIRTGHMGPTELAIVNTENFHLKRYRIGYISDIKVIGSRIVINNEYEIMLPTIGGNHEVITLSNEFYNAMINSDLNTLMSFYNFPMKKYFSVKNATSEFVEKDIKIYFSRWSYRSGSLISCDLLDEDKSNNTVKTRIIYNYSFIDNKGKKYSGQSTTTLIWKKIDQNWRIISTSEKVE